MTARVAVGVVYVVLSNFAKFWLIFAASPPLQADESIEMPFGDRLAWAQQTVNWMGTRIPQR